MENTRVTSLYLKIFIVFLVVLGVSYVLLNNFNARDLTSKTIIHEEELNRGQYYITGIIDSVEYNPISDHPNSRQVHFINLLTPDADGLLLKVVLGHSTRYSRITNLSAGADEVKSQDLPVLDLVQRLRPGQEIKVEIDEIHGFNLEQFKQNLDSAIDKKSFAILSPHHIHGISYFDSI